MQIISSLARSSKLYIIATILSLVGLWSMSTAVAAEPESSREERLLTVYDQGEERTFVSRAATVESALSQAGIELGESDSVEPEASTKLVAKKYSINVYRARPVLVVDGTTRERTVTAAQSPRQIMAAIGSTLYDEDTTHFERIDSVIAEGGAGLKLVVDRATPFTFRLYGKTITARTQAQTVGEMLRQKRVTLGPQDGADQLATAPMVAGMTVSVWRNGAQTFTQEEVVAFPIEIVQDKDHDVGYIAIQSPGKPGKRMVTYTVEMRDGVEVSRKEIQSVATLEPVKQVELHGVRMTSPSQNLEITWSYLIGQGFTREQTAGIMGNLMKEHGFNTTGDGIVQWTGGRKAQLMSRPNPYSIYTQLDFMMFELNTNYASVRDAIKASTTVEQAVVVFQNKYERCGICDESSRISFARAILANH